MKKQQFWNAVKSLLFGIGLLFLVDLILRAVPLAMGIAVTVTAILGEVSVNSGFSMLGIGLACLGILHLKDNK